MTKQIVVPVDPEFKALIPPLSAEEYAQLEANLLADGCRDPLVVWLMPTLLYCKECEKDVPGTRSEPKGWEYIGEGVYDNNSEKWVAGTWGDHVELYDNSEGWPALFCPECYGFLDQGDTVLLDGHNRHEICRKHGIGFEKILLELPDRQAAINWIINNQLGRRNLHPDQASYLRGKRYNAEKSSVGGDRGNQYTVAKDQNDPLPESTADRLATEYKVSAPTIKRDGNYAAAVDALQAAGIAPQAVIAHEPKSAVVEFARLIAPEPEPPAAPLLPPEPPKPKDPVVVAVTEKVKAGEMTVIEAAKEIRQAKAEGRNDSIPETTIVPHNHRAQGTGENEWYTPDKYIDAARDVLGGIDLDPATSLIANKAVKAHAIFTAEDNGLSRDWHGRVWLNPPYSQPEIHQFSEKLAAEAEAGRITAAIALTHNYTDTKWFHRLATACQAICFTRGRIGFVSPSGEKAAPTQGQAFFYFGADVERFVERFRDIGFVVEVRP